MNHTELQQFSTIQKEKATKPYTTSNTSSSYLTHQTWNFKQQLMINTQTWKEAKTKAFM